MYSTFRQTSKLGIDFFLENNVPVLFQHAAHRHNDLSEKNRMQKIITENFWKEGQLDKDTGGSLITHSELRHANHLLEKYEDESGINYVNGVK